MTNSRRETIGVPLAEYLKEKCWNSPKRPKGQDIVYKDLHRKINQRFHYELQNPVSCPCQNSRGRTVQILICQTY